MKQLKGTVPLGTALALAGLSLAATESGPAPGTIQQSVHAGHQIHREDSASRRYSRSRAYYRPPDVLLLDKSGAQVSLDAALGGEGPVLLQFIFTTCPTICPVMSATFSAVQGRLGSGPGQVRMVSVSIDPEHDTPERLREYARQLKAGPRWRFLTGRLEDVQAVQKAFDAYRGNKMRHEPLTFLRAAPEDPWLRLEGLMSAAALLDECRRMTRPAFSK